MTGSVRIDKWLWAARFFKTRSLARNAIQGGKVRLNNARAKPAKTLELLTGAAKERVLAVDDQAVLPGVEVLWLGGHTPCSQAVCVRTAAGEIALPGDALFRADQLESNVPIGIFHDLEQSRRQLRRRRLRRAATRTAIRHRPETHRRGHR